MPPSKVSLVVRWFCCFLLLLGVACFEQAQTAISLHHRPKPVIAFHHKWHLLGPFRIGTREPIWGVDPLVPVGGFCGLQYNKQTVFRSPLTPNATVHWETRRFKVKSRGDETLVRISVYYKHVDWQFQQVTAGWPALQHQTWARGVLHNRGPARKAWVFPRGILEFHLHGKRHFGGDFFSFDKSPVLVNLLSGDNIFNVRLFRDIRANGGNHPISLKAQMLVRFAKDEPEIDYDDLAIPDIIEGKLPSRHFSFPVRNPLSYWISIYGCHADHAASTWYPELNITNIAPGQIRPIALNFNRQQNSGNIRGVLCYRIDDDSIHSNEIQLPFSFQLNARNITEASKFTFLHPSGVVSYALLKPPLLRNSTAKIPLLVVLHGSGVEIDTSDIKHSLDDAPDLGAFTLFPSGMGRWAGDDWHLWGTTDVITAIDAVPDWLAEMEWKTTVVTTDRVVIVGHSNGGQGTWFFATHFPDRSIAAAALSGFVSQESYVPHNLWKESDPLQKGILDSARSSYRHELLFENLAHMPVFQQHGAIDDNVPAYQSRMMSSLRWENGMDSDYYEVPDRLHWWPGVLTTSPMKDFFRQNLRPEVHAGRSEFTKFKIAVPSSGEVGPKFGIFVDQVQSPDRLGRIQVDITYDADGPNWHLSTNNIHRLHFDFSKTSVEKPSHISIDKHFHYKFPKERPQPYDSCERKLTGIWECSTKDWTGIHQRYGKQRGALDSILRSDGMFQIVSCTANIELAVQISRNMFQYYGADSTILSCEQYAEALGARGNVILITDHTTLSPSQLKDFPITITDGDIFLRTGFLGHHHSLSAHRGLGATFIRPLPNERLELVVWGYDAGSLDYAAQLVPTLTGAGQPDFIIFGPNAPYNGVGGSLAMGFFDFNWNISRASYLP